GLFKSAIAFVVVEEFDHGIVGNEEIDATIAIVIGDSKAEALAGLGEAKFGSGFGEGAVAIVVVDERGDWLEEIRMAVGTVAFFVLAAPDVIEVPFDVAEDDEIEVAIGVEIDPSGAGRPAGAGNASFLRDVGERAVAIVVIELVATVGGDVKILEAVVVVVAD